jgi:predicted transcriptional regulator
MATRSESIIKARAIKTQRVKDKIIGAINILKLYGKKPTIRAIAEESGVSKTTVQKYLSASE